MFLAFLLQMAIETPDRLAVIRPAPAFHLHDQNGASVTMASKRGKVVVVSFIFTTCNGTCPATTHRMAKLHQEVMRRPELRGHVEFVSISLDPARDTPERLRGYMRLYEIDDGRWHFLTGTPGEVQPVLAAWGMWAKPAANGQLDHPSRVYLVDRQGQMREIYNLDFFRTSWVLEDIKALVDANPR